VKARSADALSITARSQNSVEGGIALRDRKLLFFSIPYDAGWRATVDGKPVELARVDIGFMALPLEAGEHRVKLEFSSPLKREGSLLSLIGLGIYGVLLARRDRLKTRAGARD
jgi:uncharacterized membrane protein YfhO